MKIKISFLLITLLLIISCKHEPKPDPNGLPPETHEGKNTFGCLIDGEVYTAEVNYTIGGAVALSGQFDEASKELLLQGDREDGEGRLEKISFAVIVSQGPQTYDMEVNTDHFVSYTDYSGQNCEYYHDQSNKGKVNISFLDEQKNIISGTFHMTLINTDCMPSAMVITDGRFDFNY